MPDSSGEGVSRRGALECMIWAGTGVLWTVSGGVPKSLGLLGDALAADAPGFTFLQISDSHVGFNKPANPDALGTLREAIAKTKDVKTRPAFMIHTGDITHLSKPDEFDNAAQLIGEAKLDVHYVPGEHDFVDEGKGKAYLDRYGKGTKGQGWYSGRQDRCRRARTGRFARLQPRQASDQSNRATERTGRSRAPHEPVRARLCHVFLERRRDHLLGRLRYGGQRAAKLRRSGTGRNPLLSGSHRTV
ncbi:MAG: metallophosphoesterase [Methyloceanibacter sp.]|nr:metallophosphoesterase [Methyloceanibacter sp.]